MRHFTRFFLFANSQHILIRLNSAWDYAIRSKVYRRIHTYTYKLILFQTDICVFTRKLSSDETGTKIKEYFGEVS